MEVLQANDLNEIDYEAELTALDTSGVEAGWLRDLLMDLPLVDKPVRAILMNCHHQGEEFKGQYEVHQTHKNEIKSCQKIKKLRCDSVGVCPYG